MSNKTKPRLTPTLKKVYVRAIELIEDNWIKGSWLKDLDTGKSYPTGAVENGERFAVCVVGGIQRAAWEILGKPDMSDSLVARGVYDLVADAEYRSCFFISKELGSIDYWTNDDGEEIEEFYPYKDIMAVNDGKGTDKETVLSILRRSANL